MTGSGGTSSAGRGTVVADAGGTGGAADGDDAGTAGDTGCGCRVGASRPGTDGAMFAGLGLGALGVFLRRRRR
jgi:MYXO-CTERM domain-containing protein